MTAADEDDVRRELTELVRASGRDVLATLARWTGNLALAEDAVQDATVRALETWPRDGVPDSPVAWLRTVARRRAVDLIRREAARGDKETAAMQVVIPDEEPEPSAVADDLLRLVFTCCHPSLAPETQVALSLRTLCGLTTPEVARALLVSEASMAKRLTRARQKILQAHIPYRVPAADELPAAVGGGARDDVPGLQRGVRRHVRPPARARRPRRRGVRLARLLVRLRPDDPGALGLLALMLLQDSRRATRVDADGATVLLGDQDRTRWDAARIEEGVTLVGAGLRRSPDRPDRYVVQAAIAACHALAPSYDETDWDAIVSWYDVLLTLDAGPVVRLNRAAAVAERDGAAAGLDLVDAIDGLDGYALWHATRGVLLRRLDRTEEAAAADARAAALPLNDAQRSLLGG